MLRHVRYFGLACLAVASLALGGCTQADIEGPPDEPSATPSAIASTPIDISGTWTWSNEEIVKFPPFVAAMLGIAPEGPNTHARCESEGDMTLNQTGSTFAGQAIKTFNQCVTKGGQVFQQPSSQLFVQDGAIQGNNLSFSFASATVRPCPHSATASGPPGGVAVSLTGTGHCYLPGHPRSESPNVLPPPGGTTKTVRWEATRP